jgi:hypothetical protein
MVAYSTRRWLAATMYALLAVGGSALNLGRSEANSVVARDTFPGWKPAAGTTWQIDISDGAQVNTSLNVQVYDIDLFDTPQSMINSLHAAGRKVICYFSAGSYENWREDAKNFTKSELGSAEQGWEGEWWLDVRQTGVRNNMLWRLDLAKSKGCDGVDPDNMDAYNNKNGLGLTQTDAINYMTFLSQNAHSRNLAIGLKNAVEIVSSVIELVEWQVNESCEVYSECATLKPFITENKPVFHIEYPANYKSATVQKICTAKDITGFSTLIKDDDLDNFVISC